MTRTCPTHGVELIEVRHPKTARLTWECPHCERDTYTRLFTGRPSMGD